MTPIYSGPDARWHRRTVFLRASSKATRWQAPRGRQRDGPTRPEPPKRREIVIVRQCEQSRRHRAYMPRIARAPVALVAGAFRPSGRHATHKDDEHVSPDPNLLRASRSARTSPLQVARENESEAPPAPTSRAMAKRFALRAFGVRTPRRSPMATRFRTLYKWLVPGWLLGEGPEVPENDKREGEKVLYSLSLMLDAITERLRLGLLARFPSYAQNDALNLIGRNRGIPRGRSESATALRRPSARMALPSRASRAGLCVRAARSGSRTTSAAADAGRSTSRATDHDRAADGTESYSYGNAWNWDGVWAPGQPRARFWIVVDLSTAQTNSDAERSEAQPSIGSGSCWGGKIKNSDTTIGIAGFKSGDGEGMRRLVRPPRSWKPAGTRAEYVIYSLTGDEPEPDGAWATYPGRLAASQVGFRFGRLRLSR